MRGRLILFFIAAAAGLWSTQQAQAGRAIFTGGEDAVKITGDGLTKVTAGNNHYQLTGGSTSFTDDCTGPQGDNPAIHANVISQINQGITDELGNADWSIELQIDPLSAGIRTDGIEGTNNPSGQTWGVGIRFGNGTNQTTSPTGVGNFGRGADVIFGFTETVIDVIAFPVLTPYVLLVGADFSLNPDGQFFNFLNAVDFSTTNPAVPLFFQDFVGTSGKITLSRQGFDEFNRPVITIASDAVIGTPGEFPSTWAWVAGNTGTPAPPVVNANFAPFGISAAGSSPGGFGSQNINFNGLIPSQSGPPGDPIPRGMPVTSLFMFIENETTWIQYADPIAEDLANGIEGDPANTSDECYGTQPDAAQSEVYNIDFDFPVDDPGEVDARDSAGLLARIQADGGTRGDINSYGDVEIQNALPAGAGRFACLTINSDAITDVNPGSECLGPTITTQPAALTVFDLRILTPPQNLTLSVAAQASAGSLTYQWKKNGQEIRALVGSSAGSVTPGVGILPNEGAGTLTVVLPDDGVAITSQTWTLIRTTDNATSPTLSDFTLNGSLTGSTPGPVSSEEGDEFVEAEGIKFFVTEDNTDSTTDFEPGDQFQVTVTAIPVTNATADNSTFSITDVDRDDAGAYTVDITDDNRTIASNSAIVTVIDPRPINIFNETWETEAESAGLLAPQLRPQIMLDGADWHNFFDEEELHPFFGDETWFYVKPLNTDPAASVKVRNVVNPNEDGIRNQALQRIGPGTLFVGNQLYSALNPIDLNAITSLTIAFKIRYGELTNTGGEADTTVFGAPFTNTVVSLGSGGPFRNGSAEYTIELTNHVIAPVALFDSAANPGAIDFDTAMLIPTTDIFPAATAFNIGINRLRIGPTGLRKTRDSTNDGGIFNFAVSPVDNELWISNVDSGAGDNIASENVITFDPFGFELGTNPANSAQIDTSGLAAAKPLNGQELDIRVSFGVDPATTNNTPTTLGGFATNVEWIVVNNTVGLLGVDSGGVVSEVGVAAAFPFNQKASFLNITMNNANGFGDGPGDAGTPDVSDAALDNTGGSTNANGTLDGIAVVDLGVLGIPEVETITVTALGGGDWTVVSSSTLSTRAPGNLGMVNASEGELYTNGSVGDVRFTITSGGLPFAAGDEFTFTIDKILSVTTFGRSSTSDLDDGGTAQGTWIDDIMIFTEGVLDVTPASARDWDIFE